MARSRGRSKRALKSEINIVPLLDVLLVLLLIDQNILLTLFAPQISFPVVGYNTIRYSRMQSHPFKM